MPGEPRTGVVLVEYHSGGLVAARAQQAIAHGYEVVVADNTDAYDGPGRVVRTGGNVGFGAACNAAVAALAPSVDVVVLQNPDATVPGRGVERLVTLVREQGWVAVAPALFADRFRPDGFAKASPFREPVMVLRECVRLRAPGRASGGTSGDAEAGEAGDLWPVERPKRFGSAALLAVDRRKFEEVGGFDERYFLYVEDLDLWERLARRGRVGFLPGVVAAHEGAAGSSGSAVRRTVLRWLGRELYLSQHGRGWRWVRLVHRLAVRCLPDESDPVVSLVSSHLRTHVRPAAVQYDVRDAIAQGEGWEATETDAMRVGWSRSRMVVPRGARVIDIGSGAFPNPRADVLCERNLVREHRVAVTDRPTVVADAEALPFRAGAFSLAITSHLAEHVEHPDVLCAELLRVAGRSYIETPSPVFERLFPEPNHRWMVRAHPGGGLEFNANTERNDLWRRLGDHLRPWYYAGASSGLRCRITGRVAFVLRGALNRSGLTVTRVDANVADGLEVWVRTDDRQGSTC